MQKCVSEHIIKQGGSVVVWRRKRGPGWLDSSVVGLLLQPVLCCAFSPLLCCATGSGCCTAECQTVHYWWWQGGPSPPPSLGKQHDRRPKSGAYLRGRGGGGRHLYTTPTSKLVELAATVGKSERPGLVGGGGTRLRGGTALRCHSPRRRMSMLELFKLDCIKISTKKN